MLRAQVRLGRSLTHTEQVHEYAVTLDGEVPFPPEDAEGVLEKVAELFHLADEALAREIEKGDRSPIAPQLESGPPNPNSPTQRPVPPSALRTDSATAKQLQFIHSLARSKGFGSEDLAAAIVLVVGSLKATSELTKEEAGRVIGYLKHPTREASK
jgi:hypothetical protein